MWNGCFVKDRPDAAELQFLVKSDYRHLRVQINFLGTEFLCRRDRTLQQLSSHTLASVSFQHGHATDLRAPAM